MRQATGRRDGDKFTTLAVTGNGLVFTTGSIGFDPVTREVPPDIETQTTNTLLVLEKILEDAGSDISKVLKINVFLDDIDTDFDAMSATYAEFFKERNIGEPPARTSVGARLPWARVEMEMVALA